MEDVTTYKTTKNKLQKEEIKKALYFSAP